MKINDEHYLPRAFALLVFACLALSPQARAVCEQGCLPNNNTLLGDNALFNNTIGGGNTATGFDALLSNTTGSLNTAIGDFALQGNATGFLNTAIGAGALQSDTTGDSNTAIGFQALGNTTGTSNIAIGDSAGINLTTGNGNIDIGNAGVEGESKHIRIGSVGTQRHTFIAGISGSTIAAGVGVIIDTNGHLGTVVSSARFKEEIKPMDKASEAILALQPVTFRYKHELDPVGILQFGLVAEDVAKVDPALVARDDEGKPSTVRYEAVNAMLLNEFLKEHRRIEQLEATVVQQQKSIEVLTARLEQQEWKIQEVSAQLEMSKPALQTVVANQ